MAWEIQPRATKGGQRLHLSYELPHRLHSSIIHPLTAPNGSTLIIYGHARGLRILWRGGRPRKRPAHANGTNGAVDLTGDDAPGQPDLNDFEADEAEQDPDCPFPGIIQHLDVGFGGTEEKPVAVLHVATIPNAPAALPQILRKSAIVLAASSDGRLRVLQVPLTPPSDDAKEHTVDHITAEAIVLDTGAHNSSAPLAGVAMKFISNEHQRSEALLAPNVDIDAYLFVASAGKILNAWALPVTADAILSDETDAFNKISLPWPAVSLSLHPSSRSWQILLADASSAVRIYDPQAVAVPQVRPGSSGSAASAPSMPQGRGKWIMAFQPALHAPEELLTGSAAFARRKKVLAARWVLGGRGTLVLLDDGEWGIWDMNAPPKGRRVDEFALHGFLSTTTRTETADPFKQRKGAAGIAPSTPRTLKAKEEQLFTGAPKISDAAPRGGISVSSTGARAGATDESVIIWYNGSIYFIASMQQLWQRSTTTASASRLSQISDVNLMNEDITSISQFVAKAAGSAIGLMNTPRDMLVSGEHRAIVLQSTRPATPTRQLFHAAERPAPRDQQMLDSGTLDLDGVDRMLDSMAAPATRRVGFAS